MKIPQTIHPLASTKFFWEKIEDGVNFPQYDDEKDYVGPARNALINNMVDRFFWGVDINRAAYRHDYHYWVGGDDSYRRHADHTFLREMQDIIETKYPHRTTIKNALMRFLANRRAMQYWRAVRIGGRSSFNFERDSE